MRRNEREITDKDELICLIDKYKVFRIAMGSDRGLHIIPMNYGYEVDNKRLYLYFHSARTGRKIDILKENNHICFEIDGEHKLIEAEKPCKYSYAYESLIGYGDVEFLEGYENKSYALNKIMKHQSGKEFTFMENAVESTAVCKITVTALSGKRHKMEDFIPAGAK